MPPGHHSILRRSCRSCRLARRGFSIIELIIVTIVIGVLAAAGIAKYQDFAESSRRKVCLANLMNLESCLAVWEASHEILAENAKCAFGFTPRTGRLTDTSVFPSLLDVGPLGAVTAMADPQPVVGGPTSFVNSLISGPLNSVIRDDRIWICPSALSRFYGGEIQNVADDYLDTLGGGLPGRPRGVPIGLGGRYLCAVASLGNRSLSAPITNGGFPAGWIADAPVPSDSALPSPCPQPPFRVFVCGSFGTFGTGNGVANIPGTAATNLGGPVGPDGSTLSRHSARW